MLMRAINILIILQELRVELDVKRGEEERLQRKIADLLKECASGSSASEQSRAFGMSVSRFVVKADANQLAASLRTISRLADNISGKKEKYSGTGGGIFALPTLPPYLIPLAEVLSEKHHVSGVPEIDDFDDDEQMNGETAAEEKDLITDDLDAQHTHTLRSSHRKSLSASARETLSLFTDKRSMLYEEEIKVAQMKQKKLKLEIEVWEVKLEEAKLALEVTKAKAVAARNPSAQVPYYFAGRDESYSPSI
ncbi:unnamed protein product [Cylicocyclus nassatus]|uniref:Uncharacterized protein n=1 Tax=Cylicocyclus nassatus TaxID=53992 RepID=A0AA36GHU5_CYLNA|nr:unnamed protein product [Cylicocyclus nassatus]